MKRIALFPGTFDPFTVGHENVVNRALALFDEVVIGVGVNVDKKIFFSAEQRIVMLKQLYANNVAVRVEPYEELTVDFAQRVGASFIVRGVRSVKDFEYERDIADVNRSLSGIETVLLFSEPQFACISSSLVRELLHYGRDVKAFIPQKLNIEKQ